MMSLLPNEIEVRVLCFKIRGERLNTRLPITNNNIIVSSFRLTGKYFRFLINIIMFKTLITMKKGITTWSVENPTRLRITKMNIINTIATQGESQRASTSSCFGRNNSVGP